MELLNGSEGENLRIRPASGALLSFAGLCMAFALVCQNITVAEPGSYRGVLLVALTAMILADLCCTVVFVRGGGLRWLAAAVASPSVFIVWDFLRRASYVF
jgi:hypothetical protein